MTLNPAHRCSALAVAAALAVLCASPAKAGSIVYTPTNPQFGGSPLNGNTLLSVAQAQNLPQLAASKKASLANTSNTTQTAGQIFAQQLTSQLYSSLANQITSAIFGENAQQNGTFAFQGTTINFNRVGSNVNVSINDGTTITNVTVPAGP
ncbi:curli assembly protein CsgF [Lichenihabitans sp. PAMC28606]|uniref:curli assembly protein CsgF n=1 Tax=Lichenihabitans sp. PAMC28606 TaxID=2880932 RepID=UPI001D0B8B29|nr:curli assembly protein CsgF [Lichenihabitans sp. PAMC28606]UDL94186.1 curli assembly protein CsgF [Lichenihabitans sp. PAMC28606]